MQHVRARVRRLQRTTIGFGLAVVVGSCGSSKSPPLPAGRTEVESAVGRAATATSLYSFSYYGGLRTLHVQLPAYDPAVTCASFAASKGSQYSDVWYLDLYIDWGTPLTGASIGTIFPPSSDNSASAYLDIVHAKAAEVQKWVVNALDGNVTFASAPASEADQIGGVQVRGHLDFTVPKEPRARTSCQGGASPADGGGIQEGQTCTCVDGAGNTSTCAAGTDGNCCTPLTGDVESFSLDISANPCGIFCVTTPGDPNNCAELSGGA